MTSIWKREDANGRTICNSSVSEGWGARRKLVGMVAREAGVEVRTWFWVNGYIPNEQS